jgi:hypothetical protein
MKVTDSQYLCQGLRLPYRARCAQGPGCCNLVGVVSRSALPSSQQFIYPLFCYVRCESLKRSAIRSLSLLSIYSATPSTDGWYTSSLVHCRVYHESSSLLFNNPAALCLVTLALFALYTLFLMRSSILLPRISLRFSGSALPI